MAYSAYLLTEQSRADLLGLLLPLYDKVICHHVTVEYGIPESSKVPKLAKLEVIGFASDRFCQALVVTVDGEEFRSNGARFHITHSLDTAGGKKPVYSNELLKYSRIYKFRDPVPFTAHPAILR